MKPDSLGKVVKTSVNHSCFGNLKKTQPVANQAAEGTSAKEISKAAAKAASAYALISIGATQENDLIETLVETPMPLLDKFIDGEHTVLENIENIEHKKMLKSLRKEYHFMKDQEDSFKEYVKQLKKATTIDELEQMRKNSPMELVNVTDENGKFIISNEELFELLKNDRLKIGMGYHGKFVIPKDGDFFENNFYVKFDFSNDLSYSYKKSENEEIIILKNENGNEKVISTKNGEEKRLIREKYVYKDSNGRSFRMDYLPSAVDGNFNIYVTNLETGEKKQIKKSYYDEKGNLNIKQNSISPAGARTQVSYVEEPNGDFRYFYKITSKDGESLFNTEKSRKTIGKNLFEHVVDGKTYRVQFKDGYKCEIFNTSTAGKIELDFSKILVDELQENKDKMFEMLKTLSPAELVLASKVKIKFTEELLSFDASCMDLLKSGNSKFIFLHELGHFRDLKSFFKVSDKEASIFEKDIDELLKKGVFNSLLDGLSALDSELDPEYELAISQLEKAKTKREFIEATIKLNQFEKSESEIKRLQKISNIESLFSNNEEFLESYENELRIFQQMHSKDKLADIYYFVKDTTNELFEELSPFLAIRNEITKHALGINDNKFDRPKAETFAEINALLSTPQNNPVLSMRTQVLMDNFPETIAVVGKLIEQENEKLLDF